MKTVDLSMLCVTRCVLLVYPDNPTICKLPKKHTTRFTKKPDEINIHFKWIYMNSFNR